MNLGPKIGLTAPETLGYGACGHPDVDAKAGHIRLPDILLYIKLGHVP
jgi:hypothetical protein